jgi:hypothetical protein
VGIGYGGGCCGDLMQLCALESWFSLIKSF